jgi:hypothetical protein
MEDQSTIQSIFESDRSAFPYEDCRALQSRLAEAEGLVPALDHHFATIAGYASSAARIDKWSAERLASMRRDLANSFFEEHPEYELLQQFITRADTPELFAALESFEQLRVSLLGVARRPTRT